METSVYYQGLKDRAIKVKTQEALGLTMKQDNFDSDWKHGDEPHGTMIFTDAITPVFTLSSSFTLSSRNIPQELDELKAQLKAKGIIS